MFNRGKEGVARIIRSGSEDYFGSVKLRRAETSGLHRWERLTLSSSV